MPKIQYVFNCTNITSLASHFFFKENVFCTNEVRITMISKILQQIKPHVQPWCMTIYTLFHCNICSGLNIKESLSHARVICIKYMYTRKQGWHEQRCTCNTPNTEKSYFYVTTLQKFGWKRVYSWELPLPFLHLTCFITNLSSQIDEVFCRSW